MQNFFESAGQSGVYNFILISIMLAMVYFVVFRPQQKRRKQEEELRKSLAIGDTIVTIGGIIGKIVSVRADSDSIVIESGSDKIKIKKWAIASCEK